MKKMLLGIFLLLLSIWCLIYGKLDDLTILLLVGTILPAPAIAVFCAGFFAKEDRKRRE